MVAFAWWATGAGCGFLVGWIVAYGLGRHRGYHEGGRKAFELVRAQDAPDNGGADS